MSLQTIKEKYRSSVTARPVSPGGEGEKWHAWIYEFTVRLQRHRAVFLPRDAMHPRY